MEVIKIVQITNNFNSLYSYFFIDEQLRFVYKNSFRTYETKVIKRELEKTENLIKNRYNSAMDYCESGRCNYKIVCEDVYKEFAAEFY